MRRFVLTLLLLAGLSAMASAQGNVIQIGSTAAQTGTEYHLVPLSLFRSPDVTESPSALSLSVSVDLNVLVPKAPYYIADETGGIDKLDVWYGKGGTASSPEAGVTRLVISGGRTLITTFDDQRGAEGFPEDQENPFPLGFLVYDVVGEPGETTSLAISDLVMSDPDAQPVTQASVDDGTFQVQTNMLPTTGMVGLIIMGGACAVAGAFIIRKKKRH